MATGQGPGVEPVLPTSSLSTDTSRPMSVGRRLQDRTSGFIHLSTIYTTPRGSDDESVEGGTFVVPMNDDHEILFHTDRMNCESSETVEGDCREHTAEGRLHNPQSSHNLGDMPCQRRTPPETSPQQRGGQLDMLLTPHEQSMSSGKQDCHLGSSGEPLRSDCSNGESEHQCESSGVAPVQHSPGLSGCPPWSYESHPSHENRDNLMEDLAGRVNYSDRDYSRQQSWAGFGVPDQQYPPWYHEQYRHHADQIFVDQAHCCNPRLPPDLQHGDVVYPSYRTQHEAGITPARPQFRQRCPDAGNLEGAETQQPQRCSSCRGCDLQFSNNSSCQPYTYAWHHHHHQQQQQSSDSFPIMKKVKRPLPYNGQSSWEDYLIQFEMLAKINQWDSCTKALELATSLQPPAVGILANLSEEERYDYDALVAALAARYEPVNTTEIFRARLKTRVRRKTESLTEFAHDIRHLTRKAYPSVGNELREHLSLEHFIELLNDPELEWYVFQSKPKSVTKALETAIEFEAFKLGRQQRHRNGLHQLRCIQDSQIQPSMCVHGECEIGSLQECVPSDCRTYDFLSQEVQPGLCSSTDVSLPNDCSIFTSPSPCRRAITDNRGIQSSRSCFRCGQRGHLIGNCPIQPPCFNCRKFGHMRDECPHVSRIRSRPKKKGMQMS